MSKLRQLAVVAIFTILSLIASASIANAIAWPTWIKRSTPVYTHPSGVASDATVIKEGSTYRMMVSAQGTGGNQGLSIATSTNGTSWTTLANGSNGIVIQGAPSSWDCETEMPDMIKFGSTYMAWYGGYCGLEPMWDIQAAKIGLVTSTNGTTWSRYGTTPVLTHTTGWYDNDAMTDPTVVNVGGTLYMLYTGWCSTNCSAVGGPGAWNLYATSTDGINWTKGTTPVANLGLHNDIVVAPDGTYHVYYNNGSTCPNSHEGIQRSTATSPIGPYTAEGVNLVCNTANGWDRDDFGFPAVINDGGVGKMWFTGLKIGAGGSLAFKIGYAHT